MKHQSFRRSLSVLLALWMTAQLAVCAFGAQSSDPQTIAGPFFAAVNTDHLSEESEPKTFTTDSVQQPDVLPAQEQFARASAWTQVPACDALCKQIEPMTYAQALEAQEQQEDTVEAQSAVRPYRVGDVKKIPDLYNTLTHLGSAEHPLLSIIKDKIRLTCRRVGTRCTVWASDDCEWTEQQIQELADYVDDVIPKLEDLFGTARIDTDKDGKVAVLIHSIGDSVAGYFNQLDIIDRSGKIGNVRIKGSGISWLLGAGIDCLHVNSISPIDQIRTIFVHEYQHYIHASYCYDGKTNADYLNTDPTYLDEGFSLASQMMLDITPEYMDFLIGAFRAADPQRHSLTQWKSVNGNYVDSAISYGLSFVFFQYIRTRYASLTGDTSGEFAGKGIYKRVLQSRNTENQYDTFGVIADILYPAEKYPALADTDARSRQLIEDFWLAVYCKERDGEHGFNGEAWANRLRIKAQQGVDSTQQICAGMAKLYELPQGAENAVAITQADEGLRFVPIEKSYTVTFDPNGGFGGEQTRCVTTPFYTLTGKEYADLYREGYVFEGWSDTPDGRENILRTGDTYSFSQDAALYAVWNTAQRIVCGTRYPALADADTKVQFCPQEDGVYFIDADADFTGAAYNPQVGLHRDLDGAQDGFYLRAGVVYTIDVRFSAQPEQNGTFGIEKRETYHELRLIVDLDVFRDAQTGQYAPWQTMLYGTVYSLPDYGNEQGSKWGYRFNGWAARAGEETPQYLPGERVTVSGDTTLYAVWSPWQALKTDEIYELYHDTLDDILLTFTPQQTASYQFGIEGVDPSLQVYDAQENLLFEYLDASLTYTLYAGQTYYIRANGLGNVKIRVRFKSASTTHYLYLVCGDKLLDVRMPVDGEYVLPAYTPLKYGGKAFIGWKNLQTEEMLYPGDTVYVNDHDVVLNVVNESADWANAKVANTAQAISMLRILVIQFLRYIPVLLRGAIQRIYYFGLRYWR